ncbi:SDR family NAD(P)-dependent oxidoreductase [Aestuariivirga litoralis]|uniref:SDR family NAD(P)-dependent oxidoreductase n=1 Tax=Aestuariivirga litoralis TaxID=2650924 RepID=UPI001FEF0554|nr:SDR family oxidoreductase [Aestuariivirga litoralis]MBG1231755.1 SDR family oxidoreductase [Aestuariivirga litoralis]
MSTDLVGKVVVVTGGVTGIGGAASRGFAKAGAKVLAQYHSGGPELAEAKKLGLMTLQLDLTGPDAPQKLIDAALTEFGRIDVLVNNAGSMVARTPLGDVTDEYIDLVFNLNCRQLVHCCRLGAEAMKKQGSGNIINVSSIAARNGGGPGASIYASAKGFVSAFSKSIARELVDHKIRVNCVSPGTIHTQFHERFSDEKRRIAMAKTIPMGYLGAADDCTGTFLYLASDEASGYITGQVIEVNGGQLMP